MYSSFHFCTIVYTSGLDISNVRKSKLTFNRTSLSTNRSHPGILMSVKYLNMSYTAGDQLQIRTEISPIGATLKPGMVSAHSSTQWVMGARNLFSQGYSGGGVKLNTPPCSTEVKKILILNNR